jgi:hypothetical protein
MRHSGADELGPAGAAPLRISQRRVPRFPNDPVLRRCAFNRCSILDTDARREQDNRRRKRPKQPPARTSRGSEFRREGLITRAVGWGILDTAAPANVTAVWCRSPPCRRCGCRSQRRRAAHSGTVASVTLDRNHRSDLATGADTEIEEERRPPLWRHGARRGRTPTC